MPVTPRFHRLVVSEVRRECAGAVSLRLDVPAELAKEYAFVQGQHVALRATLDGEELRRNYSICSGVDDGELRIAIREVPGGRFSSWAVRTLRAGESIDVLTPDGRFHTPLDPAQRKHYVAFVAGSGITPVMSLMKTTLRHEARSRFTLVYGNRQVATSLFLDEIGDLKNRYLDRLVVHTVFSRERQDADLFNGRLDGDRARAILAALIAPASIDEVFVCGPGGMIDEVEAALLGEGVPAPRVHVERFGVPAERFPPEPERTQSVRAEVVVESDGVRRPIEVLASDESILDAALRSGLDLPFSCKGGMCCTCRAKVLEGEVRMQRNYSLDAAEVQAGFVLTCQAQPITPRVVLSYDER